MPLLQLTNVCQDAPLIFFQRSYLVIAVVIHDRSQVINSTKNERNSKSIISSTWNPYNGFDPDDVRTGQ